MRPILASLLLLTASALQAQPARAQEAAPPGLPALPPAPRVLEPFQATYEAWYRGRPAGSATMRLVRQDPRHWTIELDLRAERGVASLARLNIHQSTLFDEHDGHYRPLGQNTERRAVLFGKQVSGSYDWGAMQARWSGDISRERRRPVPLQPGDMSALLINLALMRDARPGAVLEYRFVDGGRVRGHVYHVGQTPETLAVGDMSYEALRVERRDRDGDQTLVWVADGVPTPIRILQREDGEDEVDLRLIEYRGA
ncbi:DUF3108 domain-containing protein [Pseudoxanthomonas sp. SGNA-20]|jgi:Protein of unknown function (DUF3108).|uniref:Uncharacterized protein DUF3108 n=1 Tax=Pseudoxanthomonas taiwanensis J19 TaxID=935569 RepID=A0A562DLM9_9GAMM|nr:MULTISPECIES: DUF3108 domain-containing protein [Pseudoxanthomonas]RRN54216.1 DUF3108 domain-containing protein [Pseudoxanthomonas sp. SGNA-20]RRN80442.1 DUF3108 domain-containing protein [Pseudoxanthomonas sp. SGD-10]TWH10457.1 uncharacterized protein DUF3108 [Pseudoxanthomonas taiwanensis J19]